MSFVFVPSPPSPRARKLAKALHDTIEEFRRENPATRDDEVRRALRIAASFSGGRTAQLLSAVVLLVGLILALGLLTLGDEGGATDLTAPLVVGGVVLLALVAVLVRRRS